MPITAAWWLSNAVRWSSAPSRQTIPAAFSISSLPDNADLQFSYRQDLLGGIGEITGKAVAVSRGPDRVSLVRRERTSPRFPIMRSATAARARCRSGWPARMPERILPPQPTIASTSRATSSCGNGTVAENYPGNQAADHRTPVLSELPGRQRRHPGHLRPARAGEFRGRIGAVPQAASAIRRPGLGSVRFCPAGQVSSGRGLLEGRQAVLCAARRLAPAVQRRE